MPENWNDANSYARILTFLASLEPEPDHPYGARRAEAEQEGIPIIRASMEGLLRLLLELKHPAQILEIGCATGYSALLMAYFAKDSRVTTIERDEERCKKARAVFEAAHLTERVTLLEGDAAQILPELSPEYEFLFLDAAKGQYGAFLPECKRLLKPGGVLVCDNVLQEGDLLESHYLVERRNRTIYQRMRDFLFTLTRDTDLTTVILPIADGVAISVKREIVDSV